MAVSMTRSGIVYDLTQSPHNSIVPYKDNTSIKFIFSSELYRDKFEEKIEENRKKLNESLTNRFGFTIENDKLCDIKLYAQIEKRGFLIETGEESIVCLSNIRLDGHKLIPRN